MQIWNEDGQGSLFAHDGCAGRTCPAHSAQGPPRGKTSVLSWKKSFELKAIPYMFMDLTPGRGDLLGNSYWEILSPWRGGSSMLNTGLAPLNAENVSILSQILEEKPHRKYYLSKTACLGILRRAKERGKELPPQLKTALMAQAGLTPLAASTADTVAFAVNQRDEVRDLHNVAGALSAQPGMKQQTFIAQDCLNPWDTQQARVFTPKSKAPTLTGADGGGGRNPAGLLLAAGFCAGAGSSAGSIGYQEEVSPTLKASSSGNMMPSVLCLNDQGGSVMECSENIAGTLRAQEHGHQPLVMSVQSSQGVMLFENHGIDSRYTGPHTVSPTLSARAGTGGNNLPIMLQEHTMTFSRQRVDLFSDNSVASTESARQHKDATDLVLQKTEVESPMLIRRLTPMECERLQGFPDHWTDIPGASDSARYRALGNSVAIPCVEYIMQGFAMAVGITEDSTSSQSRDR